MEKRGFASFVLVTVGITAIALGNIGAAAVPLQLKLGKGKTYYQKTVIEQHLTQTIMNMQQTMDQNMGTGAKLEVLEVDSQGNMRIRHTFNWAMSKRSGPMGNLDYDSAKQPTPPAGAEVSAALLGQSYVVKLSPKGEVLDVNGVEELRAAVRKKLPSGADADPAMAALKPYLDKNGIKEMTESTWGVYPGKPVEQGESWSKKRAISLGFELTMDCKWTLQKREAGVAVIGTNCSLRTNPNTPLTAGEMRMAFDLSGTQEGTARMEEATGLITLAQAHQQLKGDIKMSDSPQGPPKMTIPATFDTTIKVEMSDKPLEPATK